ncbi:MAG TPA: hypothetical protein VFS59_07945 [Gemmatimonadaceae bacterium]|nr:hypothetical protein [Gemmatimonadaceae bacterium]
MSEHTSSDDRLDELTAGLPREVAPLPDLWPAIRAELAPRSARAAQWSPRWRLVAAGLLVAASSSILTLFATRMRDGVGGAAAVATADRAPAPPRPRAPARLPAHLVVAERGYARSIDALWRTLDERRDSLAPSTVATVERSLRIADSAIAEARSALEQDPANRVLADLLVSNYERKIDLLRRATELAPRT